MRAGHGTKLHAETAKPARGAPDEDIVAGLHNVRTVAEQHPVGGGERQRVAGALFPGEMFRARHALARLHAAELCEGPVRRLITPDALGGREHGIAAIALLIVAIILIAVNDHFVARLHARDLPANRPNDARGVGPGHHVILIDIATVERGNRLAEPGPDAIVVDAGGHHEDEHLIGIDLRHRHLLDLHRRRWAPVPLAANRPGMHHFRDMELWRNLAKIVNIFRLTRLCCGGHVSNPPNLHSVSKIILLLHISSLGLDTDQIIAAKASKKLLRRNIGNLKGSEWDRQSGSISMAVS